MYRRLGGPQGKEVRIRDFFSKPKGVRERNNFGEHLQYIFSSFINFMYKLV